MIKKLQKIGNSRGILLEKPLLKLLKVDQDDSVEIVPHEDGLLIKKVNVESSDSQPGQGYGKQIVRMIDDICRNELGRNRVWLDVYETNERANMYITNEVINHSVNLTTKKKLFICMKRRYNKRLPLAKNQDGQASPFHRCF